MFIEFPRNKSLKYANSLLKNASITPISTNDINDHLHNFIIKNQAYPSPLYYQNFPKSISISVNEIAIHGIASDYILQPGDVVKIDVSVFFQGFHGDTCQTFIVPYSEKEFENLSFLEKQNFVKNLQLINTTKKLVEVGINSVRLNQKITEIGKKMEHFIKTINFNQPACNQFSINQNYQGHGVGKYFHSLPMVPFWSENSGFIDHFTKNFVIRPGLCFTIEPVVFNCGMEKNQIVYEDGSFFNGRSLNNIRCAQVEHSLLVLGFTKGYLFFSLCSCSSEGNVVRLYNMTLLR